MVKTMNIIKKCIIFLLVVMFLIHCNQSHASQVFNQSGTPGNLDARWEGAVAKGLKQNHKGGFWVAYSIDKLMGEKTFYVSTMRITGRIHSSKSFNLDGTTLSEVIYSKKTGKIQSSNSSDPERKVMKEVALLFQFEPGSGRVPVKIRFSNMSLPFGSEGKPIYWLGKTTEDESFKLLTPMFSRLVDEDVKKRFLSAVGFHTGLAQVVPFLEKVILGDDTECVRGKAVNELGDQQLESSIKILLRVAMTDHSVYVRKKAVSALEDVELPGAVDALVKIAKEANNLYVRKRAVSTLGDIEDPRARQAIIEIARQK